MAEQVNGTPRLHHAAWNHRRSAAPRSVQRLRMADISCVCSLMRRVSSET